MTESRNIGSPTGHRDMDIYPLINEPLRIGVGRIAKIPPANTKKFPIITRANALLFSMRIPPTNPNTEPNSSTTPIPRKKPVPEPILKNPARKLISPKKNMMHEAIMIKTPAASPYLSLDT